MELSDLTEKPGFIAQFEIPMVVQISTTDGHR